MNAKRNLFKLLTVSLTGFCSLAMGNDAGRLYLTAQSTTNRLTKLDDLQFKPSAEFPERQGVVFIDPTKTFQTLLGIGGALTDAAAETFYKLPEPARQEILRAYWDPVNGIGYTLGRTSIHSCDFSSESYEYASPGDPTLKDFSVAHDLKYRIPFIKAALAAAGKNFTLFASPWSPPAWMKSNTNMLHGGKLKPECADAWANYYARFIKAYDAEGINIWGVTVQNEPLANQTWESCIYTAAEERDFLKDHLGPTLARAGLGGKKILIWDHNRDLLYERARVVLDDPQAAKYVWGVAFHWYVADAFENVRRVHEAYPKVNLLFTEACNYPYEAARVNEWHWGENYGKSMINDFNNGAVGWTDWNVLLDEKGGPNHVGNYCYAPIIGDTTTGKLTYMNSYYYLGHFSKFIRPGARRIISSTTLDELLTTAFINPDGTIVVVVMNSGNQSQKFSFYLNGKAAATAAPGHSIMTLVL
jgi:glucosylceramidase